MDNEEWFHRGHQFWMHKKTGGYYEVLWNNAVLEKNLEPVFVYAPLFGPHVWVRPESEFMDGRFVPISAEEYFRAERASHVEG